MTTWRTAIQHLAPHVTPSVLVTVAHAQGSTPREPGAKMIVTADAQYDTIGGGHLELRACEIARAMLEPYAAARRLERFALGPSLGQCCGGAVQLAFERLDAGAWGALRRLTEPRRHDLWRLVPFDSDAPALLLDADPGTDAPLVFDPHAPCRLLRDRDGRTWLCDPCRAPRAHLVLFGAGHVGAALVRALADLPCRVSWVDVREHAFPSRVPDNVRIVCTDAPEAVVDETGPGASYLVMTHSHALDLALAEVILARGDAGWFGLIGSATKRARFEHRLRARGIAPERLAAMVCPVGLPGISGKAPAVIAASVCAQLLQTWEAAESASIETEPK